MLTQGKRAFLLSCLLVLAASAPARAQQTWQDRAYINANLGFDLTSSTFSESLAPVIYDERAGVTTTHNIDRGMVPIDLEGGVRLFRSLGVGAAYTRLSLTETATVDARVPHPTLFGQPRFASLDTPLEHTESALHVYAVVVIPMTPHVDLALSGGPSFVKVSQDLVGGIQIAEESPTFATVTIAKVATVPAEEHTVGFSGAADLTYFLTPIIGVGVNARYISASVDFPLAGGGTATYDAGGFQLGFGVRIRLR